MKSHLILFLFFSWFASHSWAQELKPEEGIFTMSDAQFYYQSKIRLKLLQDVPQKRILQVVVKPSFKAEYVLYLTSDRVTVKKASENLWYAQDFEAVQVESYSSKMSKEEIELLENAWVRTLNKTEYSDQMNFTTDGVSLHFSVWKGGLKSGWLRSGDNWEDSYLIAIVDSLVQQVWQQKEWITLTEEQKNLLIETSN